MLAASAYSDLDACSDGQRLFFDRIEGRSRVRTALEARDRALRGPHSPSDLVLRHARGRASSNKIRHQRLKRAVFDQRAWTFAGSASVREHRKVAGNRVGALGHGILFRKMVHLNANWPHRMCIFNFRTSQRPISADSAQEEGGTTRALSRIAYDPGNTHIDPESLELTRRERLRRAMISAAIAPMAVTAANSTMGRTG